MTPTKLTWRERLIWIALRILLRRMGPDGKTARQMLIEAGLWAWAGNDKAALNVAASAVYHYGEPFDPQRHFHEVVDDA